MRNSASSAIEQILSGAGEDDAFAYDSTPGAPGRKPAVKSPAPKKPAGRNTQARRKIEDMNNELRLKTDLKEIYDQD